MKFSISPTPVVLLSDSFQPEEGRYYSNGYDGEEVIEYNLQNGNWSIDFVRKASGEFAYSESFIEVAFPENRDWRERRDARIYIKQIYEHTWFYTLSELLTSLNVHPKRRMNQPEITGVDEAFADFL